ncbi:hypothetical protein COL5a_009857 [Colletotrichum fioriniae]|uniref:uncharacterized protein n=1 Tax=Colletotrichum fioriniae TaxID=710243 RepID=UPI0023017146|nr:uncharacterized protein COL516b_010601 [Colletotrichum fioriniae]KAJ0297554.1 hypothetical protein COL516b_010601 [Colletotrichum fioriniae]KAJ0320226.1 hypothetical protein COL5a_009857 [Colletotrichum fioriniae]KAJ3940040.1 hypothetical protein N0V96_010038 [Colletotrichum fioriniae]
MLPSGQEWWVVQTGEVLKNTDACLIGPTVETSARLCRSGLERVEVEEWAETDADAQHSMVLCERAMVGLGVVQRPVMPGFFGKLSRHLRRPDIGRLLERWFAVGI